MPIHKPPRAPSRVETLTVTCPPWGGWSCSSLSALPNTAETQRGHTPDLDLRAELHYTLFTSIQCQPCLGALLVEEMAGLKDRQTAQHPQEALPKVVKAGDWEPVERGKLRQAEGGLHPGP